MRGESPASGRWPGHRGVLAAAAVVLLAVLVALVEVGGTSWGGGGVAQELPADVPPAAPPPPSAAAGTGRVIVVAPDGDDDAVGSPSAPRRSIAEALADATPGDQVLLRGGAYVEDVVLDVPPGTPDAPITLAAWPGEQPVLSGLLWLGRPSHWVVRGLEVTWREGLDDDDHLVKVTGGVGWVLADLHVHDARSFAAVLIASPDGAADEPSAWRLTSSCITDTHATNETNQDHLVYVNSGVSSGPGLVDANVLVGADNGVGVKLAGPSPEVGGAARVTVAHNVVGEVVSGVLVGGGSVSNHITRNRFGGISPDGAAIRSFRLREDSTTATDNVVLGGVVFSDHNSPDAAVRDGGGNVVQDGRWERPPCGAGGTGLAPYAPAG